MRVTVRLPDSLYRKAQAIARRGARSNGGVLREALEEFVARRSRVIEARRALARALRRRGATSLAGVVRLVDASRA